jgi:hypothetical protein
MVRDEDETEKLRNPLPANQFIHVEEPDVE